METKQSNGTYFRVRCQVTDHAYGVPADRQDRGRPNVRQTRFPFGVDVRHDYRYGTDVFGLEERRQAFRAVFELVVSQTLCEKVQNRYRYSILLLMIYSRWS